MFHLGGPIYHYLNHCLLILQKCTPAIIQKVRNLLADDLSSCIQTLQEAGEFCYQSRMFFKIELESTEVESNSKDLMSHMNYHFQLKSETKLQCIPRE